MNLDTLLSIDENQVGKTPLVNRIEYQGDKDTLNELHISKYAYEKAFSYARLVCHKAERTMECGGYLIAPKDSKNRIATDALLARDQIVEGGEYKLEPTQVRVAGQEIDSLGYKVLGWWHSHGYIDTFHSQIDAENHMNVLNILAPLNIITENFKEHLTNLDVKTVDGKIIVTDKNTPGRSFEFSKNGSTGKIIIPDFAINNEFRRGFSYSMVVNAQEPKSQFSLWFEGFFGFSAPGTKYHPEIKPYAEIGVRRYTNEGYQDSTNPRVKVKQFDLGHFNINDKELLKDIKERVQIRPRVIYSQPYNGNQGIVINGKTYFPYNNQQGLNKIVEVEPHISDKSSVFEPVRTTYGVPPAIHQKPRSSKTVQSVAKKVIVKNCNEICEDKK